MLNLSRLGAVRALFFKSEQYQLIDMPIHIGASVDKHGHIKAAHTRIQKVRVERAAPVQSNLFGGDEPAQKDNRPARLDAFVRKHGGLAQLAHLMIGMSEGQQQRIFEEMGKLGGKTVVEISALFDHVRPESAPQADMFAQPAPRLLDADEHGEMPPGRPAWEVKAKQESAPITEPVTVAYPGPVVEHAIPAPPTLHRYALQYRPPSIGAVPVGFISHGEDQSVPAARHGVIAYDRELTADEVKQFELVPLGTDGAELQLPKLPYAIRKRVEEAMSSLQYIADAVQSGSANLSDYKGDIEEAQAALHIFANYAGQKGIDKDKVLAELGGIPDFDASTPPAAAVAPGLVEYTTRKGKTLRGIVRTDLSKEDAKNIDPYTFRHEGGWFIREKHLASQENGVRPAGIVPELEDSADTTGAGHDPATVAVGDQGSSNATTVATDPLEVDDRQALPFGVAAGTSKADRRRLNAAASDLVATKAEFDEHDRAILRQYSGNGGCGDSLNEFYTLPEVASAMWSVAQRLGVNGEVLEPSCGPGVFLHTAPGDATVTGVEMDETSASIAKALHGDRHEIKNASLERFATQDARQFAAVLGNVPFGLRGTLIKDDKPKLKTADAYFCDTAMDKCKAAGVVGLIVPTGIMDSRTNRKLREAMLRKGQFLGAQRMPNTAFEHSHTEVTTDVIWFRKYPDDVAGALSSDAVKRDHLKTLGVWDDEFIAGNYFTGRGAENVLGKMGEGWRAKAGMGADITVEGSMAGVPEALREFQPEEHKAAPAVTDILAAVGDDEKARATVLGGALVRPYADKARVGDTKNVDGVAYVLQGNPPRWRRIDEVLQSEALTQGQDIAERIEAMMAGMTAVDRPRLEADLRAWVEAHGTPSKNKDILLGAAQDKTLFRLIGAVKSNGELSDAVLGKSAVHVKGDFEATVQGMLTNHETVAVNALARAAGIHDEEALDQLYGSPKYALDAETGEWTTRDIYLSGDLWEKSDAVTAALAGELADKDMRKKLEKQSALLMEAIAPVSLEDAFVQTNSAFLPPSVLAAFLTWKNKEAPDANKWTKELAPVEITFADGVYVITGGNSYGMMKNLDQYLNRTGLRKDDKHVIDDLNVEFKDWLCASAEYRELTEDLYNRKFRGFAEREFSNEPMSIPGMNTEGLKDYQWGGLRWALNAGKGIIAADVGLGKTARALMLARTLKTTGRAKRPMIVVPKSVLANWFAECEKWFPGSSVLTIGGSFERLPDGSLKGKDDNATERKRKYHDLQQNDYDFIICSEPSFEEIDLDPTTKGEYNSKDFWVQRGDKMGNAGDKRAKAIREAWEQARAGQEFGEGTRTDATYFNELGVDALIHDEFHHQKNLCAIKSRFGESPKFLGGGGQSMRSLDFNLKARWLLDQQNGKNVYGLTATPTKNSPIEIYAMLSHVAPEAFEKVGIRNSEEFLDRFARFEDGLALTTGGVMEDALITKGFQNMDELRAIMQRYIQRQTAEDVGLKLPERQDVLHMVDMDAEQEAKYSELRALAAESGGKDSTGDSHIFSIMDKMNKAAVDLSLVDSTYDGTKSPKYVACAQEVVKNMKDGGQIIFSDYVESHEKMVAALVKAGIPRNQIGVINAKVAPSSAKRQSICDQFNAGKLKAVIGNVIMNEGLNLQERTSDIHHIDQPWEPATIQQRNGRGLRQGNTNKGVRIHSYLAKGSFDGYRLQSILAKKDWQDMVWSGGNEVENLNAQGGISRDEMMIMLSSDPDQAREAFESNHKAKEERLIAGKTADAAQRFVKFQEVKRSFASIKDKGTQSAARLKARLDKEYSGLKHDRYFTAKQALDMETPLIVTAGGALLHAGAGFDIADGDKTARFVVTHVDPRSQKVTMRRYGDGSTQIYTRDAKDISDLKTFAYDEKTETDLVAKELAARPMVIKNLSDVMKVPAAVIAANHDALQKQLWEGVKNYTISTSGDVALVNKTTGKPEVVKSYNLASGKDYGLETHDFMLPTEENKAKAVQGWMDAERASHFGTDSSQARRGGRTTTTAKRKYSVLESSNPWNGVVNQLSGEGRAGHYYGEAESFPIKAARAQFVAEQMNRIRKAPTIQQALDEAAPLGEINEPGRGYGARVRLPKKVIATLWAKARQTGALDVPIGLVVPKNAHGYSKHGSILTGSDQATVHSALLGMAVTAGHEDLTHAMVESGLRHGKGVNHDEALRAIAQGYGHSENRILAIQKLAEKAGILDKTRAEIGTDYGTIGSNSQWDTNRSQTVRDKLAEMLASKRAENERKAA